MQNRPWLFSMLLVTMAATSMLQFALGVLAPYFTAEFSLSATRFGMAASLFFLCAVGVSMLAGWFVGRWGEVKLLALLYVLSITGFVVVAVAPAWGWILAAGVIMGVPLGLGNPITNQLIATRVEPAVQGTATGVKQAGVQVGALFVGATVPAVAAAFGWRAAVAMLAGIGVLGFALSVPLYREIWRENRAGRAETGSSRQRNGGRPSEQAVLMGLYAAFAGFGVSAVGAFLPLFAYDELGMPAGRAGQLVALIGLTGAVSRVIMGVVGNRVAHFEPWLAGLATVAAASVALLFVSVHHPWIVWPAAVGIGAGAAAWNTAVNLAVVREPGSTASSSGVVMVGFLGGMMLGPLAYGWLSDASGSYLWGWAAVLLGSVLALATSLVSFTRRVRRARRRLPQR